jgi:hypothetical protein
MSVAHDLGKIFGLVPVRPLAGRAKVGAESDA